MICKGNPVSPGIAMGKVLLYELGCVPVSEVHILANEVTDALNQYDTCIEQAKQELICLRDELKEHPQQAKIFESHISILFDEMLNEKIHSMITQQLAAPEWAVHTVYESYIHLFDRHSDAVIAERAEDLRDIRRRILRCLSGGDAQMFPTLTIEEPFIIIARSLSPSDTVSLDRSRLLAIVTQTGGSTSHSAILARSCGIPALSGITDIFSLVSDGQTVVVDAVRGILDTEPDITCIQYVQEAAAAHAAQQALAQTGLSRMPITADGLRIYVQHTIGTADDAELANHRYFDGVGLFRTEFLYMAKAHLPSEEEQYHAYKKVLQTFGSRPVILRTLDIGGDKQLPCLALPKEDNPFLGKRALRLFLEYQDVFETQLRAALRAAAHGNLWLMLPMVTGMEDIRAAKAVMDRVRTSLKQEGIPFGNDVKIGIMIEVPSIALIADHAAREVDFASIGTNDLTQYLCAADRENPSVAAHYQPFHPGVLRLIRHVAQQFQQAGKPLGVCGEMSSSPLGVAALLGCGIRHLSMGAASAGEAKHLICKLRVRDMSLLVDRLCDMDTAEEVVQAIQTIL